MALRFALLIVSLTHADGLKLLQTSRGQLLPGSEAKKCELHQSFVNPLGIGGSSNACTQFDPATPTVTFPVAPGTPCKLALDAAVPAYKTALDAVGVAATAENAAALGVANDHLISIANRCCMSSGYSMLVGVTGTCGAYGYVSSTGVTTFYKRVARNPADTPVAGDCVIAAERTGGTTFMSKSAVAPTAMATSDPDYTEMIGKITTSDGGVPPVWTCKAGVTKAMTLAAYAKICGAPCTYFPKAGTVCAVCAGYVLADEAEFCTPPLFYSPGACKLEDNGGGAEAAFAGGSMAKAFNDPRVTNMLGETFDIMAVGTMSMLRASAPDSSMAALSIAATIDRAGTRCGATYIQNISVDGSWIQEKLDSPSLQIRAAAVVAKAQSLQVSLDGSTWAHPMEMNLWKKYGESVTVRPQRFQLKVKSVLIDVTSDSHRVVEVSAKTRRFANFLNLDVRGINTLTNTAGLQVTGLLSADAHEDAAKLPPGCEEDSYALQGRKLLSRISA